LVRNEDTRYLETYECNNFLFPSKNASNFGGELDMSKKINVLTVGAVAIQQTPI
jgi:hypothetical protein